MIYEQKKVLKKSGIGLHLDCREPQSKRHLTHDACKSGLLSLFWNVMKDMCIRNMQARLLLRRHPTPGHKNKALGEIM